MNVYYVCGDFDNSGFTRSVSAYVIASCKEDAIAFFKRRFTNGLTVVNRVSAYKLMNVKDGLIFGIGESGNLFIIEPGK